MAAEGKTEDEAQGRAEDGTVGPPRWVKVGGAVALLLLATVAGWHLAGGGFRHG